MTFSLVEPKNIIYKKNKANEIFVSPFLCPLDDLFNNYFLSTATQPLDAVSQFLAQFFKNGFA